MKIHLLILFFISLFCFCQSPNYSIPPAGNEFLIIEQHGKFGLIDKNGYEILPPIYDWIKPFSDGFATVASNGLFGYINTSGEFVIKPQFHFAKDFKNQYAEAMLNGEWFYIDQNGNKMGVEKIPKITREKRILNRKVGMVLDSLNAAIEYVKNGKYIIRRNEKKEIDGRPHFFTKNALLDTLGNIIIPFGKYDEIQLWGEDKFLYVKRKNKEILEQGILDVQGNVRHKISHADPIGYLENGIAITGFGEGLNYAQGIIDPNGEWILRDKSISSIKVASSGRLRIRKKEGVHFAKLDGEILNEKPFAYVNKIIHGNYALVADRKTRKYFLTDMDGRFLTNEPVHFLQDDAPEKDFILEAV